MYLDKEKKITYKKKITRQRNSWSSSKAIAFAKPHLTSGTMHIIAVGGDSLELDFPATLSSAAMCISHDDKPSFSMWNRDPIGFLKLLELRPGVITDLRNFGSLALESQCERTFNIHYLL